MYWSLNADMSFLYAGDGVVVAWFDSLLIEQTRDLPFGVARQRSASLVLVERLTGVRLTRSWLERPRRSFDVPDLGRALPSFQEYTSTVRELLRLWWRDFRGKK